MNIGAPWPDLDEAERRVLGMQTKLQCNGQRVGVRDVRSLSDALVTIGDYAVGEGAAAKNDARLALTQALAGRVLRVRMFGSAAVDLAWLGSVL